MATPGRATILHADLDAFYASVEQLIDPRLRGRPVAVGSGVVLAASYEAKALGVRAGMAGWRARQLCPGLAFAGGHFDEYQRLGDQVMTVLGDFTPLVERISIDEAFLDVTGSVHLLGSPEEMAKQIRQRVRAECGLAISVGVATTKHLAKVASQVAKPDGMVVVQPGSERQFLAPLPIDLLWGVGPVTGAHLRAEGIRTIGDLAAEHPATLRRLLGQAVGAKLGSLAANLDPRPVRTARRHRSVGAQSALGRRPATDATLRPAIGYLTDRVASRLRAKEQAGRTVTVRVRFAALRSVTRSTTLPWAISTTATLTDVGMRLARAALADHPAEHEVSLVAVSVSNLARQGALQLELALGIDDERLRPGTPAGSARWALDRSLDQVRARFGRDALGYAAVVFGQGGSVDEKFRELAEAGDDAP